MVERLTMSTAIDCIIPMPLSPSRQRQRGFNQTLELAKYIAHYHQRHLDRRSCTKIKETAPQSQLSLEQRSKNITAKAFHIAPSFSAQHVLVIEDVVTTGHTINALTTALKCAGVATVEIWSVCRTLKVPRQN
jgi:predicted amidophosphoribosyltransferase